LPGARLRVKAKYFCLPTAVTPTRIAVPPFGVTMRYDTASAAVPQTSIPDGWFGMKPTQPVLSCGCDVPS
jgi:hypothetical protein